MTRSGRPSACWLLLTTSETFQFFHLEETSRKSLFLEFLPVNLTASIIYGEKLSKVLKTKFRMQNFLVICVTNLAPACDSAILRFDYSSANRGFAIEAASGCPQNKLRSRRNL